MRDTKPDITATISRNINQKCQECQKSLPVGTPIIKFYNQRSVCFNCADAVADKIKTLAKTPRDNVISSFKTQRSQVGLGRYISKTLRDEIDKAIFTLGFKKSKTRRCSSGFTIYGADLMLSGLCYWSKNRWVWISVDGCGNLAGWDLQNLGQQHPNDTFVSSNRSNQLTASWDIPWRQELTDKEFFKFQHMQDKIIQDIKAKLGFVNTCGWNKNLVAKLFSPTFAKYFVNSGHDEFIHVPAADPNGLKTLIKWTSKRLDLEK